MLIIAQKPIKVNSAVELLIKPPRFVNNHTIFATFRLNQPFTCYLTVNMSMMATEISSALLTFRAKRGIIISSMSFLPRQGTA